jgi:hypothetical protein
LEAFNGRLGCGRRAVGLGRLLHELRDDAIERLLCEDCIAVNCCRRIIQGLEQVVKPATERAAGLPLSALPSV